MTDAARHGTMERFGGVNNVDDQVRLSPSLLGREYVHSLLQANNVLIDNSMAIHSRPGQDSVLTGTDIHSLWSDNVTCLYVDGGSLKSLGTGYTALTIKTGLTIKARMSYATWNDRIYFTNYHEIGYVKSNVAYSLVDPETNFKRPLPAGRFIEYYRACLFVARNNILYISDPLCDYYDTRRGYKIFKDDITLLRAVDAGLYVGDSKVYWIGGDGNEDFERVDAYGFRPIPYTDLRVDGQNISQERMDGKIAMWTCEDGICTGDNSGNVSNITNRVYKFTGTGLGAAFVRDKDNVRHYINSLF